MLTSFTPNYSPGDRMCDDIHEFVQILLRHWQEPKTTEPARKRARWWRERRECERGGGRVGDDSLPPDILNYE